MLLSSIKNFKNFKIPFLGVPSVPKQNFTIFTNQVTVLKTSDPLETYSRESIRIKNESPTPEEQRKIEEAKAIELNNLKAFTTNFNDNNTANFIKVRVNTKEKLFGPAVNTIENTPSLHHPFVLLVSPRPEKITVSGRRRKVPCNLKKVIPVMRMIIGKHLYDAINILNN